MSRSKLVPLGFQVVNYKTGAVMSPVFKRREPARVLGAALYNADPTMAVGVKQLEEYVDANASPEFIARFREAVQAEGADTAPKWTQQDPR